MLAGKNNSEGVNHDVGGDTNDDDDDDDDDD